MIEIVQYTRKPFNVDAVQVTAENIAEVTGWCKGAIEHDGSVPFIKVQVARVIDERQTKAFVGDWVLYAWTGYKVYTDKAFKKTFVVLTGEVRDNITQATKSQVQLEELRSVDSVSLSGEGHKVDAADQHL